MPHSPKLAAPCGSLTTARRGPPRPWPQAAKAVAAGPAGEVCRRVAAAGAAAGQGAGGGDMGIYTC